MSMLMLAPVVTRYGGHRHLARTEGNMKARHYTLCRGTSAWTLWSWRQTPDHPLGLTYAQMLELPVCPSCDKISKGVPHERDQASHPQA